MSTAAMNGRERLPDAFGFFHRVMEFFDLWLQLQIHCSHNLPMKFLPRGVAGLLQAPVLSTDCEELIDRLHGYNHVDRLEVFLGGD